MTLNKFRFTQKSATRLSKPRFARHTSPTCRLHINTHARTKTHTHTTLIYEYEYGQRFIPSLVRHATYLSQCDPSCPFPASTTAAYAQFVHTTRIHTQCARIYTYTLLSKSGIITTFSTRECNARNSHPTRRRVANKSDTNVATECACFVYI